MIILKSSDEIEQMKIACEIVGKTLLLIEDIIEPGITTIEIDNIAESYIRKLGAIPSFKGLYGFPSSLCISVNNEVIHGMPGRYTLKDGDIVSIDCGACINGFHGDAARTLPVGNVSKEAMNLINVTRNSFFKGIEYAFEGNRLSDISHAIQKCVEDEGYSIVRDFVGHGIGRKLHEAPNVPNFGTPGKGPILRSGMVLAIEPMVNSGHHAVKTLSDGWTVVTRDSKLSAHYENTVAILPEGPEILTLIK